MKEAQRIKKDKILYVDDELMNLTVFKHAFRKHYKTFLAESAKEGLQIIKNNDIKLVISDQRMPEMTGVEFLELVSNEHPNIIRIILTGFSDVEAIINAINKGGVYKYLTKPWDKDDVKVTIDNALTSFKLKNENELLLENLKKANKQLEYANTNLENKVEIRTKEVVSQKNQIQRINEEIKSGIRYAQTIQQIILPANEEIRKHLETFIIYRPKDIVSGDFYWFTSIKLKKKQVHFLAVVDCTGHGVPGAFMSMIGSRLLSEIVLQKKVRSPKLILEELDINIIKSLKQDISDNSDGMDVSLCRFEEIDPGNFKITFAGAKHKLYYKKRINSEIEILAAPRRSIGGILKVKEEFINQEINLTKGDMLYMLTDGFADQNNKSRIRYRAAKLIKDFNNISGKLLKEQKRYLENALDKWQNNTKQRDDITLIGIRL